MKLRQAKKIFVLMGDPHRSPTWERFLRARTIVMRWLNRREKYLQKKRLSKHTISG